ncbi:unnamed protein product [Enterobius vermicularis]|uniref:FoP_duplication domain-containing protein n=1 Tax=Enterobius vermicularis TaxID=51028 RepID=A0A0N4VNT4_ENTVE|nr:unnamed protein product [Enterobius vermicularis]
MTTRDCIWFSKISHAARAAPVRKQINSFRNVEHDYREDPKAVMVVDSNDYVYGDEVIDDYPMRYRLVRPRQRFVHLPLSLRNRVNFPARRQNGTYFPASRGINRRAFFLKPRPRVFRPIGAGANVQNNRFSKNFYVGASKSLRSQSSGRGRGVRNRGNFNSNRFKREPVTHEDLDKELDAYMKKGKHPQIDVSDLV